MRVGAGQIRLGHQLGDAGSIVRRQPHALERLGNEADQLVRRGTPGLGTVCGRFCLRGMPGSISRHGRPSRDP